jgi:hypothetical protein
MLSAITKNLDLALFVTSQEAGIRNRLLNTLEIGVSHEAEDLSVNDGISMCVFGRSRENSELNFSGGLEVQKHFALIEIGLLSRSMPRSGLHGDSVAHD